MDKAKIEQQIRQKEQRIKDLEEQQIRHKRLGNITAARRVQGDIIKLEGAIKRLKKQL